MTQYAKEAMRMMRRTRASIVGAHVGLTVLACALAASAQATPPAATEHGEAVRPPDVDE
jgi:hypothetical protein